MIIILKDNNVSTYIFTIIPISAYTRENLDELLFKVADILDTISIDAFTEDFADEVVEYTYEKAPDPFTITLADDGIYEVTGPMIQKYFDQCDFTHEENVKLFRKNHNQLWELI